MAHQALSNVNLQCDDHCRFENVNQEEEEMKRGFGLVCHLRAGDDHMWLVVRIPS